MQLFSTIKQLITFKPVIMQFVLDKVYYRANHHIQGVFYLQTKQPLEVSSITIEVAQTLRITKDQQETTVIWSKVYGKQIALERLEKHEITFDFPLHFPRETKREQKAYRGDLWPLNKATDKAKKKLYVYEISATVKCKGKKETIVYTEVINVE